MSEIDGVVLGDDVKLYHFSAPVFKVPWRRGDPRKGSEDWETEPVVTFGPLPVYNDDSKIIGYASLDTLGDVVVASVSLEYSCPERLTIEIASEPLYLVAVMATVNQVDPGCVVVDKLRLTRVPYAGATNVCSQEIL